MTRRNPHVAAALRDVVDVAGSLQFRLFPLFHFFQCFHCFIFFLVVLVAAGGSHAGASSGVVLRVLPWILDLSFRLISFSLA